jgi:hypothetical protein
MCEQQESNVKANQQERKQQDVVAANATNENETDNTVG